MTLLELESVECRGTPRELGRAHGEALRSKIRAFVEQRQRALSQYFAERGEASQDVAHAGIAARWRRTTSRFR